MAETFGQDEKQATEDTSGTGSIYACKFTCGSAGTLESISIYVKYAFGDGLMACAIYDENLDLVANGTTPEQAVTSEQDGWMTFTFATPPSVSASTVYYLCWWENASIYTYMTTGITNQEIIHGPINYGEDWPASLEVAVDNDYETSIYATYYEAPPAVKAIVQAALISIPPLIVLPTLGQIIKVTGGC